MQKYIVIVSVIAIGIVMTAIYSFYLPKASSNPRSDEKLSSFFITQCENEPASISIAKATGFTMIVPRGGPPLGSNNQTLADVKLGQPFGIYEFVLNPSKTGHLTFLYDFCPIKIADNGTTITNNTQLLKFFNMFNSTNQKYQHTLTVSIANLTQVNGHSVQVTYDIASALNSTSSDTYTGIRFYKVCPGEIVTIGDKPNDRVANAWLEGPSYGCQF
jgi:hypothetical protein